MAGLDRWLSAETLSASLGAAAGHCAAFLNNLKDLNLSPG